MENSKYMYLNDRPVAKDGIGHHKIIADRLFETVHCNLAKPFVIGLFGSWGTGKSSIIEMLKARCEGEQDRKTEVVVVDAWRKDKDIFNRQFLKKVGKEILSEPDFKKVKDEIEKKTTDNTSKWKPTEEAETAYKTYRLFVVLLVLGTIIYWLITKEYQQVFPVGSVAAGVLAWLVARYFQYLLPKYSVTTDSTIINVAVHDIDHFRKIYFDRIIGKANVNRVCIVVDNLDRVGVEDALTIMRTLKTFIVDAKDDAETRERVDAKALNKVVFIVPCDDKELKKHLNGSGGLDSCRVMAGITDYKEVKGGRGEQGTDFVEKFFNVSFRIPEFRSQDAFQYAQELLGEMGLDFNKEHESTICHIISERYGGNPRKAKIFLNNFLMRYNVAKACEDAGKIRSGIITEHPNWLAIYMTEEELGEYGKDYFQRLKSKIDPACIAAIKYLKEPNDFDKIEGLNELLPMARRNEKKFAERLSERANESQEIIDAMWRNIDGGDTMSHVNTMAAVVSAIEKNAEVVISPAINGKMAVMLSRTRIQNLENMPGNIVYERILRGHPAETIEVVTKLGETVNEFKLSKVQIKYCVDVMEAILKDVEGVYRLCRGDELNRLKQEVPKAFDRLAGLSYEIVPIALRHPEYESRRVFDKSLEMQYLRSKEDIRVEPDDIFKYCRVITPEPGAGSTHIVTVMDSFRAALELYCNEGEWDSEECMPEGTSERCGALLRALRKTIDHGHKNGIGGNQVDPTLQVINMLFDYTDGSNQLEILNALGDFERYERWSGTRNTARSTWNTRGQELLEEGSEESILMFVKEDGELVVERLHKFLTTAANRFKSVCDQVLNRYPDRRGGFIKDLWGDRSGWVSEWITKNVSKMSRLGKGEIQRVLFGIAASNEYDIVVYQTLRNVRIGNDGKARDARIRHFDKLIEEKERLIDDRELLTAAELEFVTERIDEASYTTTNDQNGKLKDSWNRIDHGTAGRQLKGLVKKVIRT